MKKSEFLIDTDVIVDYLRQSTEAIKFIHHVTANSPCYLSTITIAELYAGVREGKERPILDAFVQEFEIAVINQKVAEQGGLYRRDYGKSHGVGLADALIAATAEDLGVRLVTLNKKHYPMLKSVHVPYFKE